MQSIIRDLRTGSLWFAISAIPVALGIIFGIDFITLNNAKSTQSKPDILDACLQFDGSAYVKIAQDGYEYNSFCRSSVAYFPVYPLAGRCITALTGCDIRLSLLIVSNLALLGSMILICSYVRARDVRNTECDGTSTIAFFAFWPVSFFFRMAYSESTLLVFSLLFLLGIVRRWPLAVLAFLAGLVTATRPVGIAATATIICYIMSDSTRGGIARRSQIAIAYCPVASWGLLAYMAYQWIHFGNAIAFAQTQEHWTFGSSIDSDSWEKATALLAGEPIWGCYQSDSIRYWGRHDSNHNWLFSLLFWNPILFVATVILIVYGAFRSWLSGPEIIFGLMLLIIPYVTRAYEMSMASHARFASVVIPAYIVCGRLLRHRTEWRIRLILVLFSSLLLTWSGMFATQYLFF